MADNCIHCQHPVRAKQQGIQCDGCLKWNHRTCNTGISQQQYRAAVRAGAEILWFCPPCRPDPVAESSRVSGEFDIFDQSNYILESEEFNPPRESFDQSMIYDPRPQVGLILFFFSPSDRNLTLRTLYCSLVRLNLEYFSVMWSPYTISCLTGISPCVLFNKWLPNK